MQMLVEYFVELLTDPKTLARIETTIGNASAIGRTIGRVVEKDVVEPAVKIAAVPLARVIGGVLVGILNGGEPLYDELGKVAVDSLLGARARPRSIPDDVGARILERLAPAGGVVTPGISGAQNYLTMMTHLNVESWALGVFAELFGEATELLSHSGGALESVSELREMVIQIMGGGRIMRRVLAPFIDDGIVQPAKRWTALKYRPTLLGVSTAIAAYSRGQMTLDDMQQECAQQGYSDERISMLVEDARKRITLADLFWRNYRGELSDADVAREARALGYDEGTSQELLAIDNQKRVDTLNAPVVSEAISNYIAGDIDDVDLERWVTGAAPNRTDAARMVSTAKARRAINVKHITSTRMRALVIEGIANVFDYTAALARENYPPDEITLEELSVRAELAKKKQPAKRDATLAQLEAAVLAGELALVDVQAAPAFRALSEDAQAIELTLIQVKVDKRDADAAAKAEAAATKAAREAAIEAKRARSFPALTEYRTAYVRGYIDRSTYAAALTREKVVDDDAAFLLAGADADREKWLADQAKREQAIADAEHKGLSLAEREQAVLQGILGISEFDASLAKDRLDDAARHLLVELLQAKLDDQAAAKAKRDEAATAAAAKGASVAEWEHAVLLGVRTLDQYRAFVATLPLTDAARALVVDALRAQLAAADQAKATRAVKDAAAQKIGISLAQRRRAVIAGVRPKTYYADALVAAGWPIDDQLADLDLLDTEIAAAQVARDKAASAAAKADQSTLTIAQLSAALALGLLTPAEFTDALAARGIAGADAELELQLAVAKVPDTRAGQQLHDQVDAALQTKGVKLADLEKAVRAGLMTLEQFDSDLAGRGYGVDDVALLHGLLEQKLAADQAALAKKAAAALAKTDGAPTLDELVAAFTSGAIDATAFEAALVDAGLPADVARLYARLVASGDAGA